MSSQEKNETPSPTGLPTNSATKMLEILLHTLQQNFSQPVGALVSDSEHLSASQRLLVSNLNDSVERMALLLRNSLRQHPDSDDDSFSNSSSGVVERIQVEKVLRTLAMTTSSEESETFFDNCVKSLCEVYGCPYAFIGVIKANGEEVRTVSVWAGDGLAENFEYSLEGTPCAEIINYKKELIPTGASTLYPDDTLLIQMGVDSYFGAPILSKEEGVIGLVSVMDVKPMVLNEWVAPVLGVFASRLALELQRKSALDELKELNATLEKRVLERTNELENANQELQAFSYTVSHDLRAPVRTINSFLDIVFDDFSHHLPIECLDHLSRVKRASKNLDGLIEDILRLSKVSAIEMMFKRINISSMVIRILDTLAEQNPNNATTFHVQPGITGWGDEGLIGIVLQNLLSNAWKYTANNPNPEIKMDVYMQDGTIVYRVHDNGIGFNMRYVEKIFEPFQRLNHQDLFEGNGVGMATAKRIIHRHGGNIWAESEEGQGAMFCFTLGQQLPLKRKFTQNQ